MTCNGYYGWFGYADLENDDVSAGNFQGNWVDCGDTVSINLPKGEYEAFVALSDIIPAIDSNLGVTRSQVNVDVYQYGCGTATNPTNCYDKTVNSIILTESVATGGAGSLYRVSQHEYGHALDTSSMGGTWLSGNYCVGTHVPSQPNTYECALQEGTASWIGHYAFAATGYSLLGSDIEGYHINAADSTGMVENNVAAFLWDIEDDANESGDKTDYTIAYIDAMLTTCQSKISGSLSQAKTVPGIVWCMENGVPSAAVQDSIFPHHAEVQDYSESGAEPAGWDSNDVRSTAVKNVGGN
jgi:hypothetical protein